MSVTVIETSEMSPRQEENQIAQSAQEVAPADGTASELNQPCWSVVTYKSVAVSHLTYKEAEQWAIDLKKQGISGLCIITDEAAARISE